MTGDYSISEIQGCQSLHQAVKHVESERELTSEVYHQSHHLGPRQGYPLHRHRTTNEWIVVYNADIDLLIGSKSNVTVTTVESKNQATVIHIPIGTCHTIRSRDFAVNYVVVKDGPDDFYPCR